MTVSADFGYVMIVAALTYALHQWMAVQVGMARRRLDVPYPIFYADESNPNANEFNCIQRGHQNCLESIAVFFALLLLSGIVYPVASAVLGVVYLVGRLVYFLGYSTGNPKGRMRGMFFMIPLVLLFILTIVSGVSLIIS